VGKTARERGCCKARIGFLMHHTPSLRIWTCLRAGNQLSIRSQTSQWTKCFFRSFLLCFFCRCAK
jgi:hypothetical protein